jgi:AcrR family transcriptional regulator
MSEKRSVILEQVLQLLHIHADEKFTMKKVADLIGLSKSSLYEYFPNKASMITDAILQMMEENERTINMLEDAHTFSFQEQLERHLKKIFELVDKNRLMQQLMYHPEVGVLPPEMKLRVFNQMQSTKSKMSNRLRGILDQGTKEGLIESPIDPWKERMVESMITGVMFERSNPDNTWSMDEVLKHLYEAILELMMKKR